MNEWMNKKIIENLSATWEDYWATYYAALNHLLPHEIKKQGGIPASLEAHKAACALYGIDIKNLEDNNLAASFESQPGENYQLNFMKKVAGSVRTAEVAEAERTKKYDKLVTGLKTELTKINNEMYTDIFDHTTIMAVTSFVGKNANDPLVLEFGNKYLEVVGLLEKISGIDEPDPLKKVQLIVQLLNEGDGKGYKAIAAFTALQVAVFEKYQNDAITKKESAFIKPLQWLFKYESHLERFKDSQSSVEQFRMIGTAANLHKDEVDKRIRSLGKATKWKGFNRKVFNAELNAVRENLLERVDDLVRFYGESNKDKEIADKNISVLLDLNEALDLPKRTSASSVSSDSDSYSSESASDDSENVESASEDDSDQSLSQNTPPKYTVNTIVSMITSNLSSTDTLKRSDALKMADVIFKKQFPGLRNFRKELAKQPELIEALINTKDPDILQRISTSKLLNTRHLDEEKRAELKALYGDKTHGVKVRVDCVAALAGIQHEALRALLVNKFNAAVTITVPNQQQLQNFVNQLNDALNKGELNFNSFRHIRRKIFKGTQGREIFSIGLKNFLKCIDAPLPRDECMKRVDMIEQKDLSKLFASRIDAAIKSNIGLPSDGEMQNFIQNLNKALNSREGLSYPKFLKLLTSDSNSNTMNAVFNNPGEFKALFAGKTLTANVVSPSVAPAQIPSTTPAAHAQHSPRR